jgi:hypothetical protein
MEKLSKCDFSDNLKKSKGIAVKNERFKLSEMLNKDRST